MHVNIMVHVKIQGLGHVYIVAHKLIKCDVQGHVLYMVVHKLIKCDGKVTCNYEAKNYIEQIYEVVENVKVIYTFCEFSF